MPNFKDYKLKRTAEAQDLDDRGYEGNGCGSGWLSHIACWLLLRLFKADLKECWKWHDLEYSLSRSIKTRDRRLTADADLHWNIDTALGLDPNLPVPDRTAWRYNLGIIVHSALLFKGYKAYWDI